ncbi:MAG: hypothetical protein ACTHM1_11075 [Solirubrobacteraceae bacterium]
MQSLLCYNKSTGEWKWAQPQEMMKLCAELIQQDDSWEFSQCYCCCGQAQTLVGVPDGRRPVAEVADGTSVLAGRLTESGAVEWEPAVVGFSQGTSGGAEAPLVSVAYGDGRLMVVPTDLPLLLADGLLTNASRLVPGKDRLMGVDGMPLEVSAVGLREPEGGVHHIALGGSWSGSPDGHLIQIGGVVAGDFTLQLHLGELAEGQKTPEWGSLAEIGTPEYEQANPRLRRAEDSHTYLAP